MERGTRGESENSDGRLDERAVEVECYGGYKGDERPLRIRFRGYVEDVACIEDRWYSPGETYFRLVVRSGDRYILRHSDAQDVWTLAGFRRTQQV